jgi:8-oxo-dGTP diphosphatase
MDFAVRLLYLVFMREASQIPPLAVAAAILCRGGRVLVGRRREGQHLAGSWEFPGGKVRPGERPEEALAREVQEEVGLVVGKAVLLHRQDHRYAERAVSLSFYLCLDAAGEPTPRQGQELRWVSPAELADLPTPAANREVLELLAAQLEG